MFFSAFLKVIFRLGLELGCLGEFVNELRYVSRQCSNLFCVGESVLSSFAGRQRCRYSLSLCNFYFLLDGSIWNQIGSVSFFLVREAVRF